MRPRPGTCPMFTFVELSRNGYFGRSGGGGRRTIGKSSDLIDRSGISGLDGRTRRLNPTARFIHASRRPRRLPRDEKRDGPLDSLFSNLHPTGAAVAGSQAEQLSESTLMAML